MANTARGNSGLRTIFSFFLGLVLTAFIGVGVYTFYPPPEMFESQTRELTQREQAIRDARSPDRLTEEDLAQIAEINRERNELFDSAREEQMPWGRSTSIILIVFATLFMTISLVRADQLPVISNGLLLGGIFSMLYGIGWVIATDTSIMRFMVITAALVITLGLGYLRFVRIGKSEQAVEGSTVAGLTNIEGRILEIEKKLAEAARALNS